MRNNGTHVSYDLIELNILVVDDQEDVRRGLSRLLESQGCHVEMASSAEMAIDALGRDSYDLVFTDLKMAGMSGDELLEKIKVQWPDIEVVLITGYGTIELAVSCLMNGAAHFITKPFDNEDILTFVRRIGYSIISRRQAEANLSRYQSHSIIAVDPAMRTVLEMVDQIAATAVPVLIEGASGTGKELIAHEIHNRSNLKENPFIAINCIALPDSLLESELFGYKRGSFTGAHKDTKGIFEQVKGGSIFLDEIASMSMSFQGKLLRVLQEKTIRPLGESQDVPVEFRLVAASNQSLEELVNQGVFREDLFYRLQVVKLSLPVLDQRPECIPALAQYFLNRAASELAVDKDKCPEMTSAAMSALGQHHWKGNIRELENAIYRAVVLCRGDRILPNHFGFADETTTTPDLTVDSDTYEEGKQRAIESYQRQFVATTLEQTKGNISKAAELSGLTRAAFQRIMRKLEVGRL